MQAFVNEKGKLPCLTFDVDLSKVVKKKFCCFTVVFQISRSFDVIENVKTLIQERESISFDGVDGFKCMLHEQ